MCGFISMPMEFLQGRPLSPDDLEMIRRQIEELDHIGAVDDEIRGIVARNWPRLLSKLPPEED
jgi:microsomal dipeptidase-like Zn-dependent dipeptidase